MSVISLFADDSKPKLKPLQRTKGVPLRGFEDEKFCFVVFRRGQRPRLVVL